MKEDDFKEVWMHFVLGNQDFYHFKDLERHIGLIKVCLLDSVKRFNDADFLLENEDFMYGMLLGILLGFDSFPLPEYIALEKLTKIRIICKNIIDLFKPHLEERLKRGA